MPLGLCDDCDRLYVLDLSRRPHQNCHRCSQPVRVISREETRAIAQSHRERDYQFSVAAKQPAGRETF